MFTRRHVLAATGGLVLSVGAGVARAQSSWPTRPVRIFVGSSAGGSVDIPTRALAARLSQRFGQQFVVENRAGAGGVIAAQAVTKADADGYTWLSAGPAELFNTALLSANSGRSVPYDPAKDLVPASLIQRGAGVLVVPAVLGVATWPEFVRYAKGKPGGVSMAVGSLGATTHLASELLKRESKLDITIVPYRDNGQMFNDLRTGRVDMLISTPFETVEPIRRGELKGLAVSHTKRIDGMPDIPTFGELGLPKVVNLPFIVLCAPTGTPGSIIAAMNVATIEEVRGNGADKPALTPFGRESPPMTPEELAAFIASERERSARIIKDADIKL